MRHRQTSSPSRVFEDGPLHRAAYQGDDTKLIDLLDLGSDKEERGELWNRPLHLAAAAGHLQNVRLLLSHKCSLTARNCFGNTAMEVASKGCRQVMRDYQAGGEAAHASLVEELQREAAELAARLEAERAQSERERVAQEERLAEEKRVANEAAALLAREVAAAEAARLEGERLRLEAENEAQRLAQEAEGAAETARLAELEAKKAKKKGKKGGAGKAAAKPASPKSATSKSASPKPASPKVASEKGSKLAKPKSPK